jgi:hypothetical protein
LILKTNGKKMAELDLLFNSGGLNDKLDFLNEKTTKNADGILRFDLDKVKDKKRGYKVTLRLLPNITKERKRGELAIEKITHFVDIKNPKELSGWFDSPKNFDKKATCPLSTLFFQMDQSNNAILKEKAKCLNYSKKYYSYCLVIEDEQQPETVGKIMILQYGKQIKDKIQAEHDGSITGEKCNVFDMATGKDLILIAKETMGPNNKIVPEYNSSQFKPNVSSLPIFNEEKKTFKNVPTSEKDGMLSVDAKYQAAIIDFLLKRDHELETFAPQPLTEAQHAKITEITNYLLGKSSNSYASANSKPASSDFDFEDETPVSTKPSTVSDADDFFADF